MLLIHCPYCGPRPELEFAYAGEAHIARPPDPSATTADEWAEFLYLRNNTARRARRALAPRARLRALLQRAARHDDRPFRRDLPRGRAAARAAGGRQAVSGRRLDERRPHRPRARRCASRSTARRYTGFAGDTLASALLANGVHLFGRSFKYHRPRGMIAAGSEEPNALVTVIRDAARRTPNLRATQVELYDGLVAESQNRWPSLGFDVQAVNDLLSPLLPAASTTRRSCGRRPPGTRCTSRPSAARRASASRRRSPTRTATRSATRIATCWWSAPVRRAWPRRWPHRRRGARVMLCDEQPEFGGSLLDEPRRDASTASRRADWLAADARRRCARDRNVTLLPRTTAFGYFPHNMIGLDERVTDHLRDARRGPAARAPVAGARQARSCSPTGAIERPLVFPGNDRPGVMLASAARTYLHRHGVAVGQHVVLVTGCDAAYATALDLRAPACASR